MSTTSLGNNGPTPPSRTSSINAAFTLKNDAKHLIRPYSAASQSAYGRSKIATSWKSRGIQRTPTDSAMSRDMNVRRWDGGARSSSAWDGLRRDTELWFPDGNCFVHLYGRGQSRRGPAFRVPYAALLATNCRPMLDRFLVDSFAESPSSDVSSSEENGFFGHPANRRFDLYIPAPPAAGREQAFLYHIATRNFFAWIFGRSLVGTHLGGAVVGLLNSMNQFRSQGEDNVEAILDYMDHEGYADMRKSPDHALGVLYFAEHFQFRDMWVDAFAHCCGMNDILITSTGFEHMTRESRAIITRSRMEMDQRLELCGTKLSTFLTEELSESQLNLSAPARAHLDKFRTWLQSFYVAKLGYYPPAPPVNGSSAFPTCIYRQMRTEFQKLYNLLVDTTLSPTGTVPITRHGGICVLQNIQAFDKRYKHQSLPHPFPLLPEAEKLPVAAAKRRFSWTPKPDKMKPDERLVTFALLTKATNRKDESLNDCSLVRAYRGFEKECVFHQVKSDVDDKLSLIEARKVRWILIYSVLQTLNSATKVPDEVRDVHNVPYNLSVLTTRCPTWSQQRPLDTLIRTQTDQAKADYLQTLYKEAEEPELYDNFEIKPDVDYAARLHQPAPLRLKSQASLPNMGIRKGTVRRAISCLGNMPELQHPRPNRASFHEILVDRYGNGTANSVRTSSPAESSENFNRKISEDSIFSNNEVISSRWSESSYGTTNSAATAYYEAEEFSPLTSANQSRRPSSSTQSSHYSEADSVHPLNDFGMRKISEASSNYSENTSYDSDDMCMEKLKPQDYDYYMTITTDVIVEYEKSIAAESPRIPERRISIIA